MSYTTRAKKRAIKRNVKRSQSANRQLDAFYRKRKARSLWLIGKGS